MASSLHKQRKHKLNKKNKCPQLSNSHFKQTPIQRYLQNCTIFYNKYLRDTQCFITHTYTTARYCTHNLVDTILDKMDRSIEYKYLNNILTIGAKVSEETGPPIYLHLCDSVSQEVNPPATCDLHVSRK